MYVPKEHKKIHSSTSKLVAKRLEKREPPRWEESDKNQNKTFEIERWTGQDILGKRKDFRNIAI